MRISGRDLDLALVSGLTNSEHQSERLAHARVRLEDGTVTALSHARRMRRSAAGASLRALSIGLSRPAARPCVPFLATMPETP